MRIQNIFSTKTLFVVFLLIALYLGSLFLYKNFLPYGRLNPDSKLCQELELFNNELKCRLSGCIWGSGDLTGPPFCGAYK